MPKCDKHPFDESTGACRVCRTDYCATCLVFPFGPAKPPMCIGCALEAGGVRRSSKRGSDKGRSGLLGRR